jgi:hypothetical protein
MIDDGAANDPRRSRDDDFPAHRSVSSFRSGSAARRTCLDRPRGVWGRVDTICGIEV